MSALFPPLLVSASLGTRQYTLQEKADFVSFSENQPNSVVIRWNCENLDNLGNKKGNRQFRG